MSLLRKTESRVIFRMVVLQSKVAVNEVKYSEKFTIQSFSAILLRNHIVLRIDLIIKVVFTPRFTY